MRVPNDMCVKIQGKEVEHKNNQNHKKQDNWTRGDSNAGPLTFSTVRVTLSTVGERLAVTSTVSSAQAAMCKRSTTELRVLRDLCGDITDLCDSYTWPKSVYLFFTRFCKGRGSGFSRVWFQLQVKFSRVERVPETKAAYAKLHSTACSVFKSKLPIIFVQCLYFTLKHVCTDMVASTYRMQDS